MKTRVPNDEKTVAYPEELLASLRKGRPSSATTRATKRAPAAWKPEPAETELARPQPSHAEPAWRVGPRNRQIVTTIAGLCSLAALATALMMKREQPRETTIAHGERATQNAHDEAEHTPSADEAETVNADIAAEQVASASVADAARFLAEGDHTAARAAYRALAAARPDEPVFATIARVLAARDATQCAQGPAGVTCQR